jgi:Skp family chaperone for outer membrane proteins
MRTSQPTMSRHLATGLVAGVIWAGCASSQPVVVVDMTRALRECREGRAATTDLMAVYKTDQAQLDERQVALVRTLAQIKAERAQGLPVGAERDAAANKEMQDLKTEYLRLQQQLTDEENRRAAQIQARLEKTLSKLTDAHRYARVLRVSPVVPAADRQVDLTPELIQAMDAESGDRP